MTTPAITICLGDEAHPPHVEMPEEVAESWEDIASASATVATMLVLNEVPGLPAHLKLSAKMWVEAVMGAQGLELDDGDPIMAVAVKKTPC